MSDVTQINTAMTRAEWALLLALSTVWGASFLFIAVALQGLPPLTVVLLRVGLAALALHLLLRVLGQRLPAGRAAWRAFLGMGFLNNAVPFCMIVWGQQYITSGLAAILNAMTPIMTVLIAHWATADERLTLGRVSGVAAGFAGVVVIVGADALGGLSTHVWAQLAVIGASVSYGCAAVFGRRFSRMGISPLHSATGQLSASTLLMLPVALLVDQPWHLALPGVTVWAAVAALALLCTALAYNLYFRIVATAGATNVILVTFLAPIGAVLLGWAVLSESLELRHLWGMALIALGMAAIDGRPIRIVRRLAGQG